MLIPLYLEGPAFAVYEQLDEEIKENADEIERVLLEAFSLNMFTHTINFDKEFGVMENR